MIVSLKWKSSQTIYMQGRTMNFLHLKRSIGGNFSVRLIHINMEKRQCLVFNKISMKTSHCLPWIPEPSTVNNKLKRREGSGSTGRFFD